VNTVLVTGASAGIGEATARRLKAAGWDVFAAARKDEDLERLGGEGFTPVKLDVTDQDTIAAAKAELDERGLRGLVNNAGVAVSGPMEYLPLDELRHQLEVNLVGQVAVTQAFMPNIREAKGRIVNVSSIGGRMVLPLVGPYAASKFALEAFNDSLRREVGPHGVKVACVEPGIIVTPVWAKSRATGEGLVDTMPADARRRYETMLNAVRGFAERAERDGLPPEAVAEVVGHAVTARRPRTRYVVGREARVRVALGRLLPDRAMDALIRRVITTSGGRSGGRG